MQPNSGCNAIHTGQVYVDGAPLPEVDLPDLHKCGTSQYHPPACWSVNTTAKTLHARWYVTFRLNLHRFDRFERFEAGSAWAYTAVGR